MKLDKDNIKIVNGAIVFTNQGEKLKESSLKKELEEQFEWTKGLTEVFFKQYYKEKQNS